MIQFTVNGQLREIDADPEMPLLWVLRDLLALKGTKYGCGVGLCGICAVLIDGVSNHACMVPVRKVQGKSVTTIEGLAERDDPLLGAWVAEQAPQCGYCQGGQIVQAKALLHEHPHPTDEQIDAAMSGVLCRCGTYPRIRNAIHAAARGAAPLPAGALPPLAGGLALNDWIRIHPDNTVTVIINHSEMGQGSFTGLTLLAAEELELPPERIRAEFAPAATKYKNSLFGAQFTGGSSSIRGEYEPLRRHAAEAREILIAAAAKRWGVKHAECRAFDGEVLHDASLRRASFAELATDTAHVTPPTRVALKTPGTFRFIGRSHPRLEIPDMVRGRTVYGIDVALPNMKVAVVWRVPAFGGRIEHFDAADALAVPGVRDVFEISGGIAVVADHFWAASRGREKLRVDWEAGLNAGVTLQHIYADLQAALQKKGNVVRQDGDAARTIENGARTVEAVYRTPYLAHATLEPMNCVADVRADGCDVWVGTQGQADSQAVAAEITGFPKKVVHVHTQFLGGGFGRRLETDFVAEAVEVSKHIKAPAQVVWTRADDMQHDFYRPAGMAWLRAALDDRSVPAAWFVRLAGSDMALDGVDIPYAVGALHEEHVALPSPLPTGAWRSVGASNNAFVIESFVDELAHAAGRDPLEYRLALLQDSPRHRGVLELAAAKAGWGAPLPAGHGRGIAVYRCFGSWAAMVAEVVVAGGAIRVVRATCAIDCGIAVNPDAVRAQMEGAVALGVSATLKEEIRVEGGRVTQATFEDYPILTLAEMPLVETHIVQSAEKPGGVGEPGIPIVAPAVANAVFAATGRRLRSLPLRLV